MLEQTSTCVFDLGNSLKTGIKL